MKTLKIVKGFIKGVSYAYKGLSKTVKFFKTIELLRGRLKGADKEIADIWGIDLQAKEVLKDEKK